MSLKGVWFRKVRKLHVIKDLFQVCSFRIHRLAPLYMECGAELRIAQHGQEAVDIVKERFEKKLPSYDCILMDMMMPVMDGATATVEIRKMEKQFAVQKPHTIVGLSANVGPEYTEQVKNAGMDGSMSKPFYPATLRNTLAGPTFLFTTTQNYAPQLVCVIQRSSPIKSTCFPSVEP